MNKKQYEEEVKQIEQHNKPQFIQTNTKEDPQNPYIPTQGNTEDNKQKNKQFIEKYQQEIQNNQKQHEETNDTQYKTTQQLLQEDNTENLPDITEFLETEEYIRMGTDYRIPIPITMPNGKEYKIYIRSINSNEYYNYQLQQVREKKSMNYLVARDICEDSKGNKLPKEFFEKIGFDYVEQIGEAISLASGTNGEDPRIQQVVENFLKN